MLHDSVCLIDCCDVLVTCFYWLELFAIVHLSALNLATSCPIIMQLCLLLANQHAAVYVVSQSVCSCAICWPISMQLCTLSANQHAALCVVGQSAMKRAASSDSLLQLSSAYTNSASFLPPLHECKQMLDLPVLYDVCLDIIVLIYSIASAMICMLDCMH